MNNTTRGSNFKMFVPNNTAMDNDPSASKTELQSSIKKQSAVPTGIKMPVEHTEEPVLTPVRVSLQSALHNPLDKNDLSDDIKLFKSLLQKYANSKEQSSFVNQIDDSLKPALVNLFQVLSESADDENSELVTMEYITQCGLKIPKKLLPLLKKYEKRYEPILMPNDLRFCLFPIVYDIIYQYFQKQQAVFWITQEISLDRDVQEWNNVSGDIVLTENEKMFVQRVLAFFSSIDGIVGENIATRFYDIIQVPEIRAYYASQVYIETVHNETYSVLLDTFCKDSQKKQHLFNAIVEDEHVKRIGDWCKKWMYADDAPFAQRLVAFIFMEGIGFSAAFCALFWLKSRGLLPGLTFSNELISRDEGIHTEAQIAIYDLLKIKLDDDVIIEMLGEFMEVQEQFVKHALNVPLIGMNSNLMFQYVQHVANNIMERLIGRNIYAVVNPFVFMDLISLQGKTNFFEKKVGEYSKHQVFRSKDDIQRINQDGMGGCSKDWFNSDDF